MVFSCFRRTFPSIPSRCGRRPWETGRSASNRPFHPSSPLPAPHPPSPRSPSPIPLLSIPASLFLIPPPSPSFAYLPSPLPHSHSPTFHNHFLLHLISSRMACSPIAHSYASPQDGRLHADGAVACGVTTPNFAHRLMCSLNVSFSRRSALGGA